MNISGNLGNAASPDLDPKTHVRVMFIVLAALIHAEIIYLFITLPFFPAKMWGILFPDGLSQSAGLVGIAIVFALSATSVALGFFFKGRILNVSGLDGESFLSHARVHFILTGAFFESIGIYGLLGHFFGLPIMIMQGVIIFSMIMTATLYSMPRKSLLQFLKIMESES